MRFFGSMALLAAIIIVGYSATSLFMSAFTASAEPWQQYLAGMGTAAVVAWEAGAVLLIGAAWHRGYRPVAVGASVLLVVAMMVTLVWEARIVIGGRSDKFASREVSVNKLKGIEDDLAWLRKRRDSVTKRADLDWITARIEQREKDRDAAASIREVMPEASTAAQIMGGSEERWRAFITALPLLFWMLARVLAVPLAMMAFARKPSEARQTAEAPSGIIVQSMPVPPASELIQGFLAPISPDPEGEAAPTPPKPPRKDPEPVAPKAEEFHPPRLVHPAPPAPVVAKKNLKGSVQVWRKLNLIENTEKFKDGSFRRIVKASDCWKAYQNWCDLQGYIAVGSDSVFGKQIGIPKDRREGRFDGSYYLGYSLKDIEMSNEAVA